MAVGDTAGSRYLLHFEGANITTDVFVNGRRAGGHVGGYVGFDVDLTPYLRPDAANRLDVRVDNSYDPHVVPSQKADFAIDGGITRDVQLDVLPATHLRALRVRTPQVSQASGRAVVTVELDRPGAPADYSLEVVVTAPNGRVAARAVQALPALSGARSVEVALPAVARPALWSPDSPALYTATVRLRQGNRVVDEVADRFGFRWFEFRPGGPFLLNGRRLLLRGTHWHEDYAGYGAAMPDSLRRRDMAMIRGMGANFVRLAHYPHDPAVYRAADSLGLLLWDELPWNRGGVGDAEWRVNTKRLLEEQIRQNFNHPSIVLWSVGNEVDWIPDFPGGEDPQAVDAFVRELNDLAHRLDPGRVTAMRKYPGAAKIVDVFSPSIWAGWYNGVYTDYEKALESTRRNSPTFLHMEYGGDSHVGRHTETTISGTGMARPGEWEESATQTQVKNIAQNGDWSESYIVDLMDWHLTVSEKLDWLTGNAQWAFKDFPTPLRPENPIPYVNQKGLVDRNGVPKDAYYVYRSHWTTTPKFTYIESHTWTERSGPAGKPRTVRVWSNCDAVELLLNGTSQGTKRRDPQDFPAQGLRWSVHFTDGENRLDARCPGQPASASDSLRVRYSTTQAGAADRIELSSRKLPNGNVLVEAWVVDARGRRNLDYNKRVYFAHDGSGHLLVDYGTPTRSQVIEMANGHAAIEFVPEPGGRAVIEARNQDFKGVYLVVQ
ncbi:MAG: glycoside hydrolase family 2 protein [Gemmatimonadetes bacterium]|nr:glycoside hydrolase family 2 protein [Gemmatimonadota bacterium]